MLVIFGTRIVGTIIRRGHFQCPRCNRERAYQLKQNKKYFSLFFVPVLPLGNSGDTLECSFCKTAYIPSSILNDVEYISSTIAIDSLSRPVASLGKRIGSYVADMVILILLNFPLAFLTPYLPDFFRHRFYLVFIPFWILYFFLMELLFKGTIGKKMFSIEIISEDEGKGVNVFQYLVRSIIKCIPLINIIFLFNDKRKGCHDYAAHTIVIEK